VLNGIFLDLSDGNTELLTRTTEAFDRKHRTPDQNHRKEQARNTDSLLGSSTRNTETSDQKHRRRNRQIDQKHREQTLSIDRKHRSAKFYVLARFFLVLTGNTEHLLTGNTEVKNPRGRGGLISSRSSAERLKILSYTGLRLN
jgi:hypothetical protein